MPTILDHIDALFDCLKHISPEKQQQYVKTATQHCYTPEAIKAITDRSKKRDAVNYNATVQASIEANSLAPAVMQLLADEIQACHKDYKESHASYSWNTNRTFAHDLCSVMIKVLIPITRRLKSYTDETTASASGTLETIIYWIKGSLISTKFAWEQTIADIQKKTPATQTKPPTVDTVIASSIQSWYSPENKQGPNYVKKALLLQKLAALSVT
jgi:hypothetical protein